MSKKSSTIAGKVIQLPKPEPAPAKPTAAPSAYGPDFPSVIRGILMLPSHTPGIPATTHYSQCAYCGQSQMLERSVPNQARADEQVILRCNCIGANAHREVLRRQLEREQDLARAAERIDQLFGTGAPTYYGIEPVEADQIAYLYSSAVSVYDDKIKNIAINLDDGVKVKIGKTSIGTLSIRRDNSATYLQEV